MKEELKLKKSVELSSVEISQIISKLSLKKLEKSKEMCQRWKIEEMICEKY